MILGIVALIIVGAGAFYLGKQISTKPVQPTPSPSSMPDETFEWKIYTNTTLGYSLKYPPKAEITEGGRYSVDGVLVQDSSLTSFTVAVDKQEAKDLAMDNFQLTISVKDNKETLTLNDLKKELTSGGNLDIAGIKIKNTIIDQQPALMGNTGGPWGSYTLLSLYKGKIYKLVFEPGLSSTGEKILSTFKFLPASSGPTSDPDQAETSWKTHQVENISFKLPSEWTRRSERAPADGFAEVFENPDKTFIFTATGGPNWNPFTGGSYNTIDEYTNMSSVLEKITINGQEGRQILPRAGSENINEVVFFSKDEQFIYHLSLQTGTTPDKTPVAKVQEGQKIFTQILPTFKFIK